ncbi:MAG TPA: hypothetical protein VFY16_13735 [Gemmatimonadaceae bacterium]|nr:hypothetical protein [Gemmatimonadaceae bacterium]
MEPNPHTPGPPSKETELGRGEPTLSALLHRAAEAPPTLRHDAERALRAAVTRLVTALKAEGLPPERVVIAVKRATGLDIDASDEQRRLRERVVLWSVRAFYGDEGSP